MREMLKKLRAELRPIYGNGETEAIIRIIFHYLKGWNTVDILVHEGDNLSPYIREEVEKILSRLLRHEPIQYITGEARFHGLMLKVTPDVLIPRPETSELVDMIVDDADDREDLRVLDLCTGSGCIAVALARDLKFADIDALDISGKAIAVAEENARNLKVAVRFIEADVMSWSPGGRDGRYDIIVSNPPYVDDSEKKDMDANVLRYEPSGALFVPDDNPLVFYRRICGIASDSLAEGGRLYLEINPRHSEELKTYIEKCGFTGVEVIKDSYGKDRFIRGMKR